jgi:glycosyltransferase involved in cell wall biosynthesis
MKICIVGGIYDKPLEYQRKHAFTPENILAEGLRNNGLDVVTKGHDKFNSTDNYDIVHVHHIGKAALLAAANENNAGLVFTGHDGKMLCGVEHSLARSMAFRYVLKRSQAVIALSQFEKRYLSTIVPANRVRVIQNGIPSFLFKLPEKKRNRKEETLRILFVGQLIEIKGVDILLKAFQELMLKWDIILCLVYQTASLEDKYRKLARALKIEQSIEFIGFLPAQELAQLYSEVDLLVLPSYAESLPSVVTEAFLCGLPVVASSVGGLSEQVGKYGILVPSGDARALASAIESVLAELPSWEAKALERREYAIRMFNVDNMISAHKELYRDILDRKLQIVCRYKCLSYVLKKGLRIIW